MSNPLENDNKNVSDTDALLNNQPSTLEIYPSIPNTDNTYYMSQNPNPNVRIIQSPNLSNPTSSQPPIIVQPGQQIIIKQPNNENLPPPPYEEKIKKSEDVPSSNNTGDIVLVVANGGLSRHSQNMVCPHCNKMVNTIVCYESNYIVWLLCIVLLVIFPLICCIPFFINSLKDAIHFCPACKKEIGRNNR